MKNLHVLPTDKPSYLYKMSDNKLRLSDLLEKGSSAWINQHIYITSDEEIKEGDWVICWGGDYKNIEIVKLNRDNYTHWIIDAENYKKIILTTDQGLIKDGVQAIDDDFLEWFVKNPSRDYINFTSYSNEKATKDYELIIPQEKDLEKEMFQLEQELDIPSHLRWHNSKTKQETLEEAAKNHSNQTIRDDSEKSFTEGAEWQAERMFQLHDEWEKHVQEHYHPEFSSISFKDYVEQHKKK
jgi:hypothetical protein